MVGQCDVNINNIKDMDMNENEEKKITVDLRHVMVEKDIEVYTEMDLSKPIGNIIHQQAGDIGLDDKARELYHNGKADMDEQTAKLMIQIVSQSQLLLFIKQAVIKEIEKSLKSE